MTPHSVIESMIAAEQETGGFDVLGTAIDLSVWPDALACLDRAVHFEMGDASPSREHTDFARELFQADMFRMPFPTTFWTSNLSRKVAVLVAEWDPASWRPDTHGDQEDGIGMLVLGTMKDRRARSDRSWIVPVISIRVSHSRQRPEEPANVSWRSLSRAMTRDKDGAHLTQADMEATADRVLRLVTGGVVMMMGPDVEQRIEPAPERLNRARAKRGRPAIGERRTIIVKPHAIAALTGREAAEGFERRAPHPHLRRGHMRVLHRGTDAQRIVPVVPCVVGISADARATLAPKQYVVRADKS